MAKEKVKKNNSANGTKISALSKSRCAEIIVFRILVIILVDVVVSTLFDFVKAEANREFAFYTNVMPIAKIVSCVLLAASIAYIVICLVKKIDTSAHAVTPLMIGAVCLYIFVTLFLYNRFRITPVLFYTMTVVASVLFAVYYIYTVLFYKK